MLIKWVHHIKWTMADIYKQRILAIRHTQTSAIKNKKKYNEWNDELGRHFLGGRCCFFFLSFLFKRVLVLWHFSQHPHSKMILSKWNWPECPILDEIHWNLGQILFWVVLFHFCGQIKKIWTFHPKQNETHNYDPDSSSSG